MSNGRKTFANAIKKQVFLNTTKTINGLSSSIWRIDHYRETICFPSYGDRNSSYGWNIHHIDGNPQNNKINNLMALHHDSHDRKHK